MSLLDIFKRIPTKKDFAKAMNEYHLKELKKQAEESRKEWINLENDSPKKRQAQKNHNPAVNA